MESNSATSHAVREDSRSAIVASGRALFGAQGYANTSLVDVSRAAHVTKGAVYHHFGSKEGLFRAVYDAVEAEARRRARSVVDLEAEPLERIQSVVAAYLDVAMDPVVQRVTLIDAPAVLGPNPNGPLEAEPGFLDFRSFIEVAVAGGHIKQVDPDAISRVIRGASAQAALHIAHAEDQAACRARIGEALRVLIAGLAAR